MPHVETTLYTTLVGDDEPIEELPAEIISYGYRHNGPGKISFKLSVDHEKCTPSVIYPGTHEVAVERNQALVWKGPILTAAEDRQFVTFGGEGLLHYLRRMFITRTMHTGAIRLGGPGWTTSADQFKIARDIIREHQEKAGGDFGIDVSATDTSGVVRTQSYFGYENKNVWEALLQLAERLNGFDFSVDPATRELLLYYPRRGQRINNLVWDDSRIRGFGRTIDSTKQASQILAVGEGEGDAMLRISRQDAGAVATNKLTQAVMVEKDIKVLSTLQDRADTMLARTKNVRSVLSLTVGTSDPGIFSYGEGDEGKVVYSSEYDPISEYRMVIGRDISWNNGEEQATLYLGEVA